MLVSTLIIQTKADVIKDVKLENSKRISKESIIAFGNIKLGKLLCDQDIITKRQLNKALQAQIKGDKRTIGEILVDMNFCSLEEITEVILKQDELKEQHKEPEPTQVSKPAPTKIIEEPKEEESVELSEDKVMNTI